MELPEDLRQKVLGGGVLQVERVQRSVDAGMYTCTARNKQGHTARRTAEVEVIGKTMPVTHEKLVCLRKRA